MLNALWSFSAGKNVSVSDAGWPSVYKKEIVSAYSTNNERVRQLVPRRRLLIQDHSKGWKLIAKFLGKDIPDKPYPHRNTRAEWNRFSRRLSIEVSLAAGLFVTIAAYTMKKIVQVSVKGNKNKTE
jgi:hypothetical protein